MDNVSSTFFNFKVTHEIYHKSIYCTLYHTLAQSCECAVIRLHVYASQWIKAKNSTPRHTKTP